VISRKSAGGSAHRNPAIPERKAPRKRSRGTGSREQEPGDETGESQTQREAPRYDRASSTRKCLNLFPPGTARRAGRGSPSPPRHPGSSRALDLHLLEEALLRAVDADHGAEENPLGMLPSNPEKTIGLPTRRRAPGRRTSTAEVPAHPSAMARTRLRSTITSAGTCRP